MKAKIVVTVAMFALVILASVMTALAQPLPQCEDTVFLNQNCSMVTPRLSNCTVFNYDIINLSGAVIVDDDDLFLLNNSIYFFNFTLTNEPNDYVVHLCDGTTREVQVEGEDDGMTMVALSIIFLIGIWGFYKLGSSVDTDDGAGGTSGMAGSLKIFFYALMVISMAIAAQFGIQILEETVNSDALAIFELFFFVIMGSGIFVGFITFMIFIFMLISGLRNRNRDDEMRF